MRLDKKDLPQTVEVGGKHYEIQTDHYWWFMFSRLLKDSKNIPTDTVDGFFIGETPENKEDAFSALFGFYYEEKELPRKTDDEEEKKKVLDYDIDSDLLYSALLQCYGVDLFEKALHWHKVRAMITGLVGTKLNDIIGYRCSNPTYKEKEMLKVKEAWELPQVEEEGAIDALEAFNSKLKG